MKKLIYLLGCLIAVALASCSSDEPPIVDDSQPEPEIQHVSKADFERLVEGKIWAKATELGNWVGDVTYVAITDDGVDELDYLPICGVWFNYLGMVLKDGEFKVLRYRVPGDPADTPMYYVEACDYEYDETTGMINLSATFNFYGSYPKSLYVEKVGDDELVIHTQFGILKRYVIDWEGENGYIEFEEKESNESYAREVYKAVSREDIANSWGSMLGSI